METIKFTELTASELKLLKRNKFNRELSGSHVSKLKTSLLEGHGCFPPIMVNRITQNVVDGEHRKTAFIHLIDEGKISEDTTLLVQVVEMSEDEENEQIIKMQGGKPWRGIDIINAEVKKGNTHYQKLVDFCKSHALTNNNGKIIARYGGAIITGKNCSAPLKNRTLQFTDSELKNAETIYKEIDKILKLLKVQGSGVWIETLAISWHDVRNHHSFDTWIKQMRSMKTKLMRMPKQRTSDWNSIFSEVHMSIDKKQLKEDSHSA